MSTPGPRSVDVVLGHVESDHRATDILFDEPYGLAVSQDHALATHRSVEPEEVAAEVMIVRRQCKALQAVSRFFTQRYVRPYFVARTINDDCALAYLRASLGITIMPRWHLQPGIAKPALSGFTLNRRIGILTDPASRRRFKQSRSWQGFADVIRTCSEIDMNGMRTVGAWQGPSFFAM